MNAGDYKFHLTPSSLYHLWIGGTRLPVEKQITIPRVVLIIDVSKWQGEIDFVKMKAEGVDGVIIKCGQGTLKDLNFDVNWTNAKAAGLLRGSYWFFDSRYSPPVQAYWWNEWTKADRGELIHVPDYEETYGGAYRGWQNLKAFIVEFQRVSLLPDERIVIYSGYYYWIANSPTNALELNWFGKFPLWLAWYTTNPANVIIPRPWDNTAVKFWGWQYGTNGVDGQTPNGIKYGTESIELDESNYNGTEAEYSDRYGAVIQPPPNGGTMHGTARETLGNIASVRSAPDVSGAKIGSLPPYTTVSFMELVDGSKVATDKWLRLTDGASYINQNVAGKTYFTILTMPTPEPPPVPVVSPVIHASMDFDLTAKTMVTTRRRADGTSDIDRDPIG